MSDIPGELAEHGQGYEEWYTGESREPVEDEGEK